MVLREVYVVAEGKRLAPQLSTETGPLFPIDVGFIRPLRNAGGG